MHSHPSPELYTAALQREERETAGVPLPLSVVPLVLFLLALVALGWGRPDARRG